MQAFLSYRLPRWAESLAYLCQKIPTNGLGRRLVFLLRKPVLALKRDVVDIAVLGVNFRLYPSTNLSDKRLLCTPGMLDGVERDFFARELPSDSWLIDIGANIGGYALQLAGQREDLRIHCVEPDPEMASRLRSNIAFNAFESRIAVSEVAMAPESGEVTLYLDAANRGKNSLLQQSGEQGESVSVPALTLEQLLEKSGAQGDIALKMDIEGFEHDVLAVYVANVPEGRWPRWVQLEQYRKEPLNQSVELLLAQGYQIRMRTRMNVILELEQVDG